MREKMSKIIKSNVKKKSILPPMGGWSPRFGQKESSSYNHHADYIENWVVGHDGIETRPGYKLYAELEEEIDFLWSHQNGAEKYLIAIAKDKVYEIGPGGEVKLIKEELPIGEWMAISFQNKSLFVNEFCQTYEYAAGKFEAFSFEGADHKDKFSGMMAYKGRLFYWQPSSLCFYYGELHKTGGKVEPFDLGLIGDYKGQIVHINKMIIPSSNGAYEALAIFLSSGQIVFYKGSDPANHEDWQFICTIQISRPIHSNAILSFGHDLLIIGEEGYLTVSQYLTNEPSIPVNQLRNKGVTKDLHDKIKRYGSEKGWSIIVLPKQNWIIFNLPAGRDIRSKNLYEQHIYDFKKSVWSKFTGINARVWVGHDGEIYFAEAHKIYKAFAADDDNGSAIEAQLDLPYMDFETASETKKINFFKPLFDLHLFETAKIGFTVDHDPRSLRSVNLRRDERIEIPWGASWEEDWIKEKKVKKDWYGINVMGKSLSMKLNITTHQPLKFFGAELIFERGGVL